MKKVNLLLTLLSLNAVLVTIERFSFTTKIILQPYSFLRLHEVIQMTVIILLSVIIPFFLLKELTGNFEALKTRKGTWLGVLFVIGTYFYATGNGAHEIASYLFNTFCPIKTFTSTACGSMFFNDFYFGNILYFIGLLLSNISLIAFELLKPTKAFSKKEQFVTILNGLVYALTLFAYAAFDRVLVGLVFTIVAALIIDSIVIIAKKKLATVPFTLYCTLAYTLSAIAALIIRLH